MEAAKQSTGLLLRLLSASSLRAKVLAGNVANQNVPGYKRRDVQFEDLVRKELGRTMPDPARVAPQIVVDQESPSRADGNNVVMETEMTAMRENRMMYELYASILRGQLSMLQSAIHGDR